MGNLTAPETYPSSVLLDEEVLDADDELWPPMLKRLFCLTLLWMESISLLVLERPDSTTSTLSSDDKLILGSILIINTKNHLSY